MTDPTPCAVDPCRAILSQDESLICSDCLVAVSPLIRAAVAAERERSWKSVLALSSEELKAYESATSSANEYTEHLTRHAALGDAIAAILRMPDA